MFPPNKRLFNLAGALMCAGMIGYALYSEHVLYLDPCPLCIFQRIAVIAMGVVFLLAAIHNPAIVGSRIYAALLGIAALAGSGVAGWHIYLQNLPPDEVPSCGPGLGYMLDTLPLSGVLNAVFAGSGECAEVSWRLLGLSMPAWVLIAVLVLGTAGIYANSRRA